ncbi:hypothetical protein [Arenimonas sp.]|uniref:hypothetical protein n=1 Tax=Arenimonas sp. TaxID=1872635 RepID=UPI0039E4967C
MPRAKSNRAPKVPGATTDTTTPEPSAAAAPVEQTPEQKAAAIATVAETKVSEADAEQVRKQLDRQPGELPDASEIDPKTLKRSVRTKQGWITPAPPPKA